MDHHATSALLARLEESGLRGFPLRKFSMELLSTFPNFDWCGVYVLDGDRLQLDAFVGDPTDHVSIPVGRGVCGTAVAENRNQVIADVRELENYLSCSLSTRSEIVVLIRSDQQAILGQIDVDGHVVRAFGAAEEAALEQVAKLLASRWN